MITVPSRQYVIIKNPVLRDEDGAIVFDEGQGPHQQVKLRHAEREIRLSQDPFPLYPGEKLEQDVTPLTIVSADAALRIRAILDFTSEDGVSRVAGDEYLFEGPGTYTPRVEEQVIENIRASLILPNHALKVRARKETKSRDGVLRVTGSEWLIRKVGAYLPGAYEEVLQIIEAVVITDKKALHVRATKNFEDEYGNTRRTGDEWLITLNQTDAHIPAVEEEVISEVPITVLTNRQYTVILDPCDDKGRPQLGSKKLVKGPAQFFLKPGESLEQGIQPFFVLGTDEALILRAQEAFLDKVDEKDVARKPGDKWMIRGPAEYVPTIEVEVLDTHRAIPLDDNEGIYVRDTNTGQVKMEKGKTYMLTETEELWQKDLPQGVEELLMSDNDPSADRSKRDSGRSRGKRDKSRVVSFRVPHNAAVQIYDYKLKKARVVFGPELVMLGPEEQFTQLSLSGGKPKKPNVISALCLLLGPDFCTDIITIETADHARLQIQLSYNWNFDVDKSDSDAAAKLFSVPDFVGDMCKAVASRVRGAVAAVQFDDFHKNSAKIIRSSVFGVYSQAEADAGLGELGKVRSHYKFEANSLRITSIDIQSAEPVDQRTRDALQKSVQLAIEITTNSQEATARHEAQRLEQEAKGRLERQKIRDEADAEESRQQLLTLQAQSAAVESSGQAKAEAQSRAEAAKIEGEAAVEQAKLRSEAAKIEAESEIERLEAAREAELKYIEHQNQLQVHKERAMMEIEQEKFKAMVDAIGADTLKAMAQAGPEMQVKLLQGLGLKSTLITDGKSPINLFQTAQGMIGGAVPGASGNSGD
jgi:major vault protein